MRLYPYIAPVILTPLAFYLWYRNYYAVVIPIVWAYIVPGIGTNVLKMWEFDVRLRLGRFRPHHGFVFGSATATIAWLVRDHGALVTAAVLFLVNFLYDVQALRAGILHVYNQPWADGKGEVAIVLDYAPWFFGVFGLIYAAGLRPEATMLLTLIVPPAGYACQSMLLHGHWGMRPIRDGRTPSSAHAAEAALSRGWRTGASAAPYGLSSSLIVTAGRLARSARLAGGSGGGPMPRSRAVSGVTSIFFAAGRSRSIAAMPVTCRFDSDRVDDIERRADVSASRSAWGMAAKAMTGIATGPLV